MYHAQRIAKWEKGQIAYLVSFERFSKHDYTNLIASHYIPRKATNHPVIVLEVSNGMALITTVSAYSSDEHNNYLPPWKQPYHKHKKVDDFHFFAGSARPPVISKSSVSRDGLTMIDGHTMPKPQASWIYLQSVWTVPFSVLGRFDKSSEQLRLDEKSLRVTRELFEIRCTRRFEMELAKFPKQISPKAIARVIAPSTISEKIASPEKISAVSRLAVYRSATVSQVAVNVIAANQKYLDDFPALGT